MSNRITVLIDVTVDKANRALGDFRKSITDADGAAGKFKAGVASVGASLKANILPASAAAGAAMYKLGTEAVDAASNLEQAVGAVEKSFGDASDEVLAFAQDAADSVGLSVRAYSEAAVRLGSFAKQIANDTGRPVAEVLNELIVRSSDLAATFGVDVSEAIGKVSSGLAGESEPLRAWGIDMRKTAIQANAAATGIDDMGEATQAAGLLMRTSSDYAGQFADESETLAGQQQRLGAELENMLATLGENLTPVITEATKTIRDLMDVTRDANAATGGYAGKVIDLAQANYKYLNPVGQARTALEFLTKSTDEATEATESNAGALVQASIDAALLDQKTADLVAAQEDAAGSAAEQERAQDRTNDSIREAQRAVNDLMSAQLAAIDSNLGYRNAQASARDAVMAYDAAAKDAGTSTEDLDAAARDAEGAVLAQAAAAVQLAEDQAAANGSSLTAIERNNLFKQELEALAGYASGPLKTALEEYIAQLGRIPRSVSTSVGFSRGPTASVSGYRAKGGPVSAGGAYVVGEDGPELLQMGSQSGNVIPNGATVGAAGGSSFYLTVNAGMGANGPQIGAEVVRYLKEYERRNGPGWRS